MGRLILSFMMFVISIFGFYSFGFSQTEQLRVVTYYPSPEGTYDEERTNKMAIGSTTNMPATDGELRWGTEGYLRPDQGASIELGGTGTPYIDFKNTAVDYNMRIILNSASLLTVAGGTFRCTNSVLQHSGAAGVTTGCIQMEYGSLSGETNCPSGYTLHTTLSGSPSNKGGVFYCCN